MTKLEALKILSDAFHYLYPTGAEQEALNVLSDKFHHVRRSLTIMDLAPKGSFQTEGLNPTNIGCC